MKDVVDIVWKQIYDTLAFTINFYEFNQTCEWLDLDPNDF